MKGLRETEKDQTSDNLTVEIEVGAASRKSGGQDVELTLFLTPLGVASSM